MKVTGQRFIDNLERVVGIIPHFETLVLNRHGELGVSKPLDYTFKFPFDREMHPEIFESCIDAVIPDNFDFLAKFPNVDDQIFEGRVLSKLGIEHVTFSWWTINLVEIKVGFLAGHLRRLLKEQEAKRWSERALRPSYESIVRTVERFEAPTWVPQTQSGSGDPTATRFSGDPWLPVDVHWPLDENSEPMLFVAQFNLASLPEKMQAVSGDSGLISVFCSRCPSPCENDDAESSRDAALFRFTLNERGGVRTNRVDKKFRAEASTVIAWVEKADFPDRDDLTGGLLDIPGDIKQTIGELRRDVLGTTNTHATAVFHWGTQGITDDLAKRASRLKPHYGNKLGGWPHWSDTSLWKTQGGNPMQPFFQFNAADGLGLGYPVSLTTHLFIDPSDTKIMKMTGWQNG